MTSRIESRPQKLVLRNLSKMTEITQDQKNIMKGSWGHKNEYTYSNSLDKARDQAKYFE